LVQHNAVNMCVKIMPVSNNRNGIRFLNYGKYHKQLLN